MYLYEKNMDQECLVTYFIYKLTNKKQKFIMIILHILNRRLNI